MKTPSILFIMTLLFVYGFSPCSMHCEQFSRKDVTDDSAAS
jgi:hypothetical protein